VIIKRTKSVQKASIKLSSRKVSISLPKEHAAAIGDQFRELISPFVESAGLISDYIRFFRQKAALKAVLGVRKIAAKERIDLKVIPPKFLIQWFESVSLEGSDSELIGMWSRLLLAAATEPDACKPIFIDILKKMGTKEARIVEEKWKQRNKRPVFAYGTVALLVADLEERCEKLYRSANRKKFKSTNSGRL
jgi:Abortive infection alpha